jgi:NifU-like protein involved in Fe-S cluster formation
MSANEFMKTASELRELAKRVRSKEGDPYANAQDLACVQLNSAALQCQRIAEALAERERTQKAGQA